MERERQVAFCEGCHAFQPYTFRREPVQRTIRGKAYSFTITRAYCTACGTKMMPQGLGDRNVQEIDVQYRRQEGIITVSEIKQLMKMYKLGKTTLSRALGLGDITVTRYLNGQVPSKRYSDMMKEALSSVPFMQKMLEEHRSELGEAAYQKSMAAVKALESLFAMVPASLLRVIAFMLQYSLDITPLTLEKLLYYANGIHDAVYGKPLFECRCEAWVRGPVYAPVYRMFSEFGWEVIDDPRFRLLEGYGQGLSPKEKKTIDDVMNSFGLYSGKVLEMLTHRETPWREARKGYKSWEHSYVEIPEAAIRQYFSKLPEGIDIGTAKGMRHYIAHMLTSPKNPELYMGRVHENAVAEQIELYGRK